MGKSKNKPNAFLMFMIEWKKNQERKGRTFPGGLKEVQQDPDCNNEWKSLSDYDKAFYKEQAKNSTYNDEKTKSSKKTGIGELVDDVKLQEQKLKEFKDNMNEYITQIVKENMSKGVIEDTKFFLIHVNYFYIRILENNELEYFPAEISIGEVSLKDGFLNMYHVIVNERIIIGHYQAAKEQSNKYHQIPLEPSFGETDYERIFHDICAILGPKPKNGKYPPLYTLSEMGDVYSSAKSVLAKIASLNNESEEFFTLYSFENFFATMYNAIVGPSHVPQFEPISVLIEIKKDPFSFKSGICCEYHEKEQVGTLYCSTSLIQRWFFVFASFCCPPLHIELLPGVHLPVEQCVLPFDINELSISSFKKKNTSHSVSGYASASESFTSDTYGGHDEKAKSIFKNSVYKPSNKAKTTVVERPLRTPNTPSVGLFYEGTDSESLDIYSECSFPSIGRGKKNQQKIRNPGKNNSNN